jgi:hypothetical protein
MLLETKFLGLKTPVTAGSYFGEWRVTWAGGWTRHKLSYLAMVDRPTTQHQQKISASTAGRHHKREVSGLRRILA